MKALFTHSYFYRLDVKQWKNHQPYPPLGTLLAASVARELGVDVSLFDSCLAAGPDEIKPLLEAHQPDVVFIYDDGFNYLTKMCLTVMREAAWKLISHAKASGAKVVVCSSDSTDTYEQYLDHKADIVIRGEGEETLEALLPSLSLGAVEPVPGIAYRVNGVTQVTERRPVLRDLDKLPMPAWDLVEMDLYRKVWKDHHGYFSLNLATTRGCPYKCNWCAKPIYGNRYHSRSPEHVVDEIEFLLQHHHPDHFWMCDDIFGLRPGWVRRFRELVEQRKLKFNYKIQSRVDLLLEEDTVKELARSGAETVWVGAESGSQAILDAMDKGTRVEQISEATRLMKLSGMRVGYFLQFGYLGETRDDIEATLRLLLSNMPDEIGVSVSYPLPGTKFYEKVRDDLKEKRNWSDSDDLAMMYRSTFPPAYYKILHRYIHSRYSIQRGLNQLRAWRWNNLRWIASMIYHTPLYLVQSYRLHSLRHAAA